MNNGDKIILHLCAKEGSDSKPYRDAGYDVRIIGEDIGVENYIPPPERVRHHCEPAVYAFQYCENNKAQGFKRGYEIG